jgi:hypothetical protein
MADLYPVAGMKIFIGGAIVSKSADFVEADFNTQVWVPIDGWETMGAIGDAVALISTPLINRGRDVKLKGTANAPSMQNQFAVLPADPGQVALIAAGVPSNKNNYAFKIEGNEGGTSPSERLFIGLVMGTPEQGGGANTAQLMSATIEINSNIVKVAAVA